MAYTVERIEPSGKDTENNVTYWESGLTSANIIPGEGIEVFEFPNDIALTPEELETMAAMFLSAADDYRKAN